MGGAMSKAKACFEAEGKGRRRGAVIGQRAKRREDSRVLA
jgi:hypothetical protein